MPSPPLLPGPFPGAISGETHTSLSLGPLRPPQLHAQCPQSLWQRLPLHLSSCHRVCARAVALRPIGAASRSLAGPLLGALTHPYSTLPPFLVLSLPPRPCPRLARAPRPTRYTRGIHSNLLGSPLISTYPRLDTLRVSPIAIQPQGTRSAVLHPAEEPGGSAGQASQSGQQRATCGADRVLVSGRGRACHAGTGVEPTQ